MSFNKLSDFEKLSENLRDLLPVDIRGCILVYLNRQLGPQGKSLKDLLAEGNEKPEDIAKWLTDSVYAIRNRPAFGAWKKNKNTGLIPEIYEAWTDNS